MSESTEHEGSNEATTQANNTKQGGAEMSETATMMNTGERRSHGYKVIAMLREQLRELAEREGREVNYDDYVAVRDGLSRTDMAAVSLSGTEGLVDWFEQNHPKTLRRVGNAVSEQLGGTEKAAYADKLWDNACDTYLMHQLGAPGAPPVVMGLRTPNFRFAYMLGDNESDDVPCCQWRNLRRDEIETAAAFITGDDAEEFREFADWMVPSMNEGEELLQALERLGFVQPDKQAS